MATEIFLDGAPRSLVVPGEYVVQGVGHDVEDFMRQKRIYAHHRLFAGPFVNGAFKWHETDSGLFVPDDGYDHPKDVVLTRSYNVQTTKDGRLKVRPGSDYVDEYTVATGARLKRLDRLDPCIFEGRFFLAAVVTVTRDKRGFDRRPETQYSKIAAVLSLYYPEDGQAFPH